MTNKNVDEVRADFVKKSKEARVKAQENAVLQNLYRMNEAQKKSVETLATIDDLSGGNLDSLYNIYKAIKSSSKKEK